MAGPRCHAASTSYYSLLLFVLALGFCSRSCQAHGPRFGFDVHHLFSAPVQAALGMEGLPEKGSFEYYQAMAHRDRIIRGRHLAASNDQLPPVTFENGNDTSYSKSLGFLHYANVTVGTPSLSFMVALDTGSDLFWLPCDCTKGGCVNALRSSSGQVQGLNIYSPNSSSTSGIVPCSNSLCPSAGQCPSANSNCSYRAEYASPNSSSTGILVKDVLHLITDNDQQKAVDAQITFGCSQTQTGIFLRGFAPNGLFGLDLGDLSVPSMLARNGITSNAFSMCFGSDGLGRITFGNKGSSNQKETPFFAGQLFPAYNISITQIIVGENSSETGFSALFDSGTSFTSLTEPAYTFIAESFNSQVNESLHPSDPQLPFEYCYDLSPNQTSYHVPDVDIIMQGGDKLYVNDPTIIFSIKGGLVYCLGLLKSEQINTIGQNFMTGYDFVFDRERMVLGWKESNCYDDTKLTSPAASPSHSPAVSPSQAVNPKTTKENGNNSIAPTAATRNHSPKLEFLTYTLTMLVVSFFAIL